MSDQLTPERTVRLLRAKAAALEHIVAEWVDTGRSAPSKVDEELTYLRADIALIAGLLADHIERVEVDPS